MDLPYQYLPDGRLKEQTIASATGSVAQEAATSYLKKGALGAGMALFKGIQGLQNFENAKKKTKETRTTQADVVSLSGCKDKQTSADTHVRGYGATGAMSFALISTLRQNPRPSYGQLLGGVRAILSSKYSQIPQLSAGKMMDMNQMFQL